MQFKARLATVRGTPSRADDVRTVVRLNLEAHDIPSDWLFSQLGEDLVVNLAEVQASMGPLFESDGREEASAETDDEPAGEVSVLVPSAGRRRNGTRSSERV